MALFDFFRPKQTAPEGESRPRVSTGAGPQFMADGATSLSGFLRSGYSGPTKVTPETALKNMALLRCVTLISESIGMLPLNLIRRGDAKEYATDHPLYGVLKTTPNTWQTPYEIKSQLQLQVMLHGNAYARVIRSRGQVLHLIPLDATRMTPKLNANWVIEYKYQSDGGGTIPLQADEVLHLRDLSQDGIVGMSRVALASEAIGIAIEAEKAASRLFTNGVMAGGALYAPNKLSDAAYQRLEESIYAKSGAANAHKWMILEEGLKAEKYVNTASDSQHIENRAHQIEEVARAFGVPRPLLMMDDTSWGSGIEALGVFFVQYALQHWFTVWEQAIERTLLTQEERKTHYVKFNERALLRGTLKDQSDFFAKALGAGGHSPWMTPNEVRELQDLAQSNDENADKLQSPLMRSATNVTDKTA